MRNLHEQQNFQLKTTINCVYERDSLLQLQNICFIGSIQTQNPKSFKIFLLFVQRFWKRVQIDTHQLTNTALALFKVNFIANCHNILTIMQSLVGFIHPTTTQSTKTLANDNVFVKSSIFESRNHVWLRNFYEQQNFKHKTTIHHANEHESLFQIQKVCFICSIQQQKPNLRSFFLSFVQ